MKKFIPFLLLTASLVFLVPSTSEARDHGHRSSRGHSHSCGSCGDSIYRERCIVGYSRCGDPIYGWRTASHSCRSGYRDRSHHHRHHGHSHGHHGSRGHISFPGIHLDFGGHHRH